jgi:hypothetical protein
MLIGGECQPLMSVWPATFRLLSVRGLTDIGEFFKRKIEALHTRKSISIVSVEGIGGVRTKLLGMSSYTEYLSLPRKPCVETLILAVPITCTLASQFPHYFVPIFTTRHSWEMH